MVVKMFDELINKTEEKVQNIFKNIEDIVKFILMELPVMVMEI